MVLKFKSVILVLLLAMPAAYGLEPTDKPYLASVRIKSHGGSGTIIKTSNGRSWILSCAHMFFHQGTNKIDPSLLRKTLRIDGYPLRHAIKKCASARVVAYDAQLDLSLIVIENGPLYYIPVAKRGHRPGKNIWSLGYDNMRWPITKKRADILFSRGDTTYTVQKPWHGRSGGGLIDVDHRVLIGVVQGYEVFPNNRGLYVSHDAIVRFLSRNVNPAPAPQPPESFPPFQMSPQGGCGPFGCPPNR